jgi:ClpP class serine protease
MLALNAALNAVWAMEEQALENLLVIAARQNDISPDGLEAYRAKNLASAERLQIRDKVAILNATGPMFKRANMMTALSGATSYDVLRRDLQAAADAGVSSLLMNVDSPGGEASGVNELAQAVYEMRDQMRIVAYVGGVGASAGYWLASAAQEIIVDPTAMLGSIGVQVAFSEPGPKAGEKRFRFVSSQSPHKNADADTEAGAKGIQRTIDAMAQVFVDTVARNRGVTVSTVLGEFGKGGIFVGQNAVNAGLADRLGSFEGTFAELSGTGPARVVRSRKAERASAVTRGEMEATVSAAVTQAEASAAARLAGIAGIARIAAGYGLDAAAVARAGESDITVEAFALEQADVAARRRLQSPAQPARNRFANVTALRTDHRVSNVGATIDRGSESETINAIAARIIAA